MSSCLEEIPRVFNFEALGIFLLLIMFVFRRSTCIYLQYTVADKAVYRLKLRILITAERKEGKFDIELTLMEQGKVYNVPKEVWFYSITQKDTKMMYVQDSNCSMDNSDFMDLTAEEVTYIQENAKKLFAE